MKKALISVYNKEGVVDFAKELEKLGYGIISTGGTYKLLINEGLKVEEVTEITNFPEVFDGRIKTLHPNIHCGILYRRDNDDDVDTLKKLDLDSIDIVVNNLYPFEEYMKDKNKTHEEIIEKIDIGGPSMIRAAAKNYKYVNVIIDPCDFDAVLKELKENNETSIETRQYLARKVFNYTAYYDSLISSYFNKIEKVDFPEYISFAYKKKQMLRYGENPHQDAAFYIEADPERGSLVNSEQLHGKELSFNNINDANAALEILKDFGENTTVVAVKHTNPCGISSADNVYEAYKKAYDCDKESIFGGIIATNAEVDEDTAKMMNEIFLELVIAPSFSDKALEILKSKKNIRLIKIDDIIYNNYKDKDFKKVIGGCLLQNKDNILYNEYKIVSKRKPDERELEDLMFAWKAVKNAKSNATLLVKNKATIGIGLGSVNRFFTVERSVKNAQEKINGAVLASDGFFPFTDSIELLSQKGVTAIIQPGGSIKDEDVIKVADEKGIAMIFTGMRHFKH